MFIGPNLIQSSFTGFCPAAMAFRAAGVRQGCAFEWEPDAMAEILEGFGGTPEQALRAMALLKSPSHAGRLRILCLLVDGEMNVTRLADALGASPVTVSQQLMRQRAKGIVQTRRDVKSVIYSLARDEVATIVTALRDTFCKQH